MQAIRSEDYRERLPEIGVPVLIIAGRGDAMSSEKINADMHRRITGSQLVFFEQSGHFPFMEEEERFRDVIDGFMQQTPATTN